MWTNLNGNQSEGLLTKLIDKVKDEVETIGFVQLVEGATRSWSNQPDSLIDQCWLNAPIRLVHHKNLVRAFSDHNIIVTLVRTKDRLEDSQSIVKRYRKNWDPIDYREEVKKIDWSNLMASKNVDIVNDILVTELSKILDKMAPIKTFQQRKNYRSWMTEDLKLELTKRDQLRELARDSKRLEDWAYYRTQRNKCVKLVKSVKIEHYNQLYKNIEAEKDTKKMFKLTGELLDDKQGTLPQGFPDGWKNNKKAERNGQPATRFLQHKDKQTN